MSQFDAVGQAAVPTVVLQGETGTGKGLVARVIHDSGPRAPGPFIDVNCAAIPDTLLEAELFGVEAGAFTDAKRAKPGLFEAASGGTLFLDELAALPLTLQGKLLTAIEAKRVRRVGAVVEHTVDVKLIAATQVALSVQVEAGQFRADLYHRLAVVVLDLPPLRARGDDILRLARTFLQQYAAAYGVRSQRLSQAAEAWLLDYPWLGNVRELSHLLERVVLLESATVIDPESRARRCLLAAGASLAGDAGHIPRPDEPADELSRLTEALQQSGGNLARAARLLGMSRGSLRYHLHKYGLSRPSRHPPSLLRREESGARGAEAPIVISPQEGEGQGERVVAQRDESPAGHLGTLLVAAETGESPGRWLAVGETLSLPVRLLGHAEPGELLVSAPMARLTDGWMEVQTYPISSGAEPSNPLLAYRVVGLMPQRVALAGSDRRIRTPLLGRARELAALEAALAQVEGGRGQVVGIVGEPGMGKSRLLAEWRQDLAAHEVTYLEGHCWSYGSAMPYLPVLDLLRAHCGITPADHPETMAEKVREGLEAVDMAVADWAPYLLRLLEIRSGTEVLVGDSPETLKAKTFEALRQICLHLSQQHPLILAVENLHWIDPTSETFFARLVDGIVGARVLVLATYRPGYQPPWLDKSYATQLTLTPLSPEDSVQIVRAVLDTETVPVPLAQTILAKAQGNPFFLEEIAQTLVEQGTRRREGGTGPSSAIQLPATVQGVLGARIDRLSADEKALLQTRAVIGHRCPRQLLMQVLAEPEAEVLQRLINLQAAELIYELPAVPAPTVTFKHILTQEVAYHSLSQEQQRVLHEQIAQAIEVLHSERLAERYGELAHHYSRSGNTQQAVAYLLRAGQQAADQSAYGEAITHLTRGLELLQSLPEAPERTRHELDGHIALGWALIATKGQAAPDAEQAFTRARALCEQVGETPQLFAVLGGLRMMYEGRGELQQARELAEQLLSLAQREQHPGWLMRAYNGLGSSLFCLGEFALARTYLDQAMALDASTLDRLAATYLSDPIRGGSRLGVSLRRHAAGALWYLGYPEQARQRSDEALTLAQELAHPYSLAYALYYATMLHCLRREAPAAQSQAEAMIGLARQREFPALELRGTFLRGWALAAQGQRTEGMAQMRQGMEAQRMMVTEAARAYRLALLAKASAWTGQTLEALRLLDNALALTHQCGGHYYQAEVYRLTGEVLRMQHAGGEVWEDPAPESPMVNGSAGEGTDPSRRPAEAETWFRQALDIARRQQAKSLELRAAMSLSRLWQQQGKCTDAYRLLAPIYGWFTEGFDTADLQDAKALLDALTCNE